MPRLVAASRLVAALAAAATVVIWSTPAGADYTANGYQDGDGATVSAGNTGSPGGVVNVGSSSGGGASGAATGCSATYQPLTNASFYAELERGTPHPPDSGKWYLKYCDGEYKGPVWLGSGGAGPGSPAVDPAVLAQEAKRRLPVPTPTITMTPPADKVIVNAPVFMSIDPSQWGQRSASASAGGVTSTVVGVPEKVVWNMGDGQQVTCKGPGTPYDPNQDFFTQPRDCGYEYKRSSAGYPNDAMTVTATLYYHAAWSAAGAPGGGDLGLISATSAPFRVRVNEIQAIVVPNGSRPSVQP